MPNEDQREPSEGGGIWPQLMDQCLAIREAGGRPLLVGGMVRDRLLGMKPIDCDVEVFGLDLEELATALSAMGPVDRHADRFGVLRCAGTEFSLPRTETREGAGHRDFAIHCDPSLSFELAAKRRDFTINSIGEDPFTGELLDPFGGQDDLTAKRLRVTDPEHFAEDALRALRAMQQLARFELYADEELIELCRPISLDSLSGERIRVEFDKLLLRSRHPSLGLAFLVETGLIAQFEELEALQGVPQDPTWHPEGDVWTHNQMVIDEAARLRIGEDAEDRLLMYAALCHDLGKPGTTTIDSEGKIRSAKHEAEGERPTRTFLERLSFPESPTNQIVFLVRHHLAPAQFATATPKAYRRLARKLKDLDLDFPILERVARADHLGRTTEDALARDFAFGDRFLEEARAHSEIESANRDVVQGRHLIARGLEPGPRFGRILSRCRSYQDETGEQDPERILDAVLAQD